MPPAPAGGRARSPAPRRRTQPSEEGRFARRRRRATSLRSQAEVFYGQQQVSPGLVALARVLVLAAPAARRVTAASPLAEPRIVSLSPTATEDLFAIGAGKQVVAVDDQSNYPASAPQTKLSGYTPNVEAIAALQARSRRRLGRRERHRRGARQAEDPGARSSRRRRTLADAYAQIAQLGKATGHARRRGGGGRGDEDADRGDRRRRCRTASRSSPSTTSSSPTTTRRRRRRSSARSTRCSA